MIPIDEFDGEFLGMFYRSAVGRVLSVWAVYGTTIRHAYAAFTEKIQGEGVLDYRYRLLTKG